MKAVIIDPALHSMGGHHFNATLRLETELAALKVDHACLGSAFADGRTVAELRCTPCFTTSVYGQTYDDPAEFAGKSAITERELARGLRALGRMPDLLVLPCCDRVLALALARQLRRARLARKPFIVLWILFAPHHAKAIDDPSTQRLRAECRDAFVALRDAAGTGNILAYCETDGMAAFYRDLTGLPVAVAPGPGLIAESAAPPPRRRPRYPVVTCLGFANEAKGYALLPEALPRVLAADRDVRFMIHGVFAGSDAPHQAAVFRALADLGPRIAISSEVLSPADYRSWLEQADLLLLPYDPEVYRTRGSGVFFEARRLGIPVVATQGCGFAQAAFDAGWGVAVPRHAAPSLAGALLEALGRLDDMTTRARAAAVRSEATTAAILGAAVAARNAATSDGAGGMLRRLFRSS